MKLDRALIMVLSLLVYQSGCNTQKELVDEHNLLVLNDVTLIDGNANHPVEHSTIVIKDSTIIKVGKADQFRFPEDATIINLKNQYVVPGFIDTHMHIKGDESSLDEMMSTLLGFGITSFRSPGTVPTLANELQRRMENGLLSPGMQRADSSIDIEGTPFRSSIEVSSEEEIRKVVSSQISQGVDYIKLYMGTPMNLIAAAVSEAHSHNVKVLGHLKAASWTDASNAGIDGLVHCAGDGPIWELLDSTYQDRFQWDHWGDYMVAWSETAGDVDLYGSRMQRLVNALIENKVEVNPTMVNFECLYWGNDTSYLRRMEPKYAPEPLKKQWGVNWQQVNPFMAQWNLTNEEWAQLKIAFGFTKKMIRHFYEQGVLLTAGSDVDMPWVTPGISFHREMELLKSCGIPNMDVIKIATRNGAQALGILDQEGTIEAGKHANLVVLESDPLIDISNTRDIDLVIFYGKRYKPKDLLH